MITWLVLIFFFFFVSLCFSDRSSSPLVPENRKMRQQEKLCYRRTMRPFSILTHARTHTEGQLIMSASPAARTLLLPGFKHPPRWLIMSLSLFLLTRFCRYAAEGIKKRFLPGRRSVCQWTPALPNTLPQVLQPRNYRNDTKRPTFELAPRYTGITVFKHFHSFNAVNLSFHHNLMALLASMESFFFKIESFQIEKWYNFQGFVRED